MNKLKIIQSFCLLLLIFLLSGCDDDEPNTEYFVSTLDLRYVDALESDIISNSALIKENFYFNQIGDTISCFVLIPKEMETQRIKTERILYLLHGLNNDYSSWIFSGDVRNIFDYYIDKGLDDMIIVMPDALNSYYVDGYADDVNYETFFFKELMPQIELKYGNNILKDNRYIAGYSMGGYGAAYYGLKYSDLFSFVYAMSAPLDGKGDTRTPAILNFVNNENILSLPFMVFDIGVEDDFLKSNITTHTLMELLNVPHELLVREGNHDWSFWKESLFLCLEKIEQMEMQ